ncbi:zinc ribbon domain-containing protein [Taibaiella lutea]|uniref:Zinc ribbon domain-containing protein n=1 Tax=Taibaiella lutea TaxID=2608001 RepID=A0A5M6CM93_9BACT|nr:zinc ribbon domain-containing protein [Taibaiella lutea]KAA5536117.1 zinc ribbon domain-containing protein [Taibaiella lutea]
MIEKKCPNCQTNNISNARYCSGCGYELPKIEQEIPNDSKVNVLPSASKSEKTKKRMALIFGIIGAAFGSFVAQHYFFDNSSFDKKMMQVASEINKTCPIMVDQFTRLDNTLSLPNNTFQYNYTIVGVAKSEVNIDTVKKYIEPTLLNNVKTSPDMKIFRDNKMTLVYNYRDKNGEHVWKFSVTPEMYR